MDAPAARRNPFVGLTVVGALVVAIAGAGAPALEAREQLEPETAAGAEALENESARFQFALAQALRYEADYAGARRAFEAAVALEPKEPYLRLAFAEFLYEMGDLISATTHASAARRMDPDDNESLRLLARINLRQTDKSSAAVDHALQLFTELSQREPDDLESRVSAGRLLMSLGRFEEAHGPLLEAFELRPDDPRLASLLLAALQGLEDGAKAESGLRAVVGRFPGHLDARLALANLLADQGRHGDALAVLEAATAEQLESLDVLRVLALEFYRTGDWSKALASSEKWLRLAPSETPARYLNALALSAVARYSEAETALRALYLDEGRSFDVARVLAEVIERQGRSGEAAAVLAEAADELERDGQSERALQARLELVDLEVRAANWEQVIEMTMALRSADGVPNASELDLVRAEALLESDRGEEALELLATLAEDPRTRDRALARQAETWFRIGDAERAERGLVELAQSGGREPLVLAARTLQQMELYEQAIPLWRQAKADDPEALDIRFWLGSAYERSGRRDSAISEFRALLAKDELFAPALNYLGYMWAEKGENLAEAVDLVERAVALEPGNGAYVDSLGWAHFQLGNYEEARGHLELAARLVGDDAIVFEHLGDVYRVLGKKTLAAESYRRALDLRDENEEVVRRKLDQLNGDS